MTRMHASVSAGVRTTCALVVASSLLWLAAPAGATSEPLPPAAVLDALSPGGDAFNEAAELNATRLDGSVARSSIDIHDLSFGSPMRYFVFRTSATDSKSLTVADFSKKRGVRWIAVEYKQAKPVSVIEVDNSGEFVQLDGWLPDDVKALDKLGDGAQVLGAGGYGDEIYLLNADRTLVSPLNQAARELTGGSAMSASDFRLAKLEQERAAMASQPKGLPADAVGALAPPAYGASTESRSAGTNWRSVAVAALGIVFVGTAAFIWGRGGAARRQGGRPSS